MYPIDNITNVSIPAQTVDAPMSITREQNCVMPEAYSFCDNGVVRYVYEDGSKVVVDSFRRRIGALDSKGNILENWHDITTKQDLELLNISKKYIAGYFQYY